MGTSGASSGIAKNGRPYGTEFTEILKSGNIKFVRYNDAKNAKSPMETMTKKRVYVTVNNDNQLKSIVFFDKNNKRYKQIDIDHTHIIDGKKTIPHTHKGYNHDEHGTTAPTKRELKIIERVQRIWYNYLNK